MGVFLFCRKRKDAMDREGILGSFEQLVLLAVLRLGDDAYGMTVRQEIERQTGDSASLGAVYATLERLEQKGLVRSRAAPGGAERGGRARRYFKVEAAGSEALRRTFEVTDRMRMGVPLLAPVGVRR
jgi:PadR family transcriptional regulator, regulatory protein PadR